jgi:hypothetical protein
MYKNSAFTDNSNENQIRFCGAVTFKVKEY